MVLIARPKRFLIVNRLKAAAGHRLSAMPRAVLVLFGVGLLLRILVMVLYSDVTLTYYGGDSTRYMRLPFTGYHGLFSDPASPAGYPAFLQVARWVSHDIIFTIGLQRLMGIGTALLVLLALRRLGAPWWAASMPAAVALLSGDHLFLETSILTETLWMLLLAAGVWATFSASPYPHSPLWLALAGVLFALSATVRQVSLPFALFFAVWVAGDHAGRMRDRLRCAGLLLLPALIVLGCYVGVARIEQGYAGFTDMSGFDLYGRVATFADCKDFTPPAGTRALCNDVPPSRRDEGANYYEYDPSSPYYRAGLVQTPKDASIAGRFARAALEHQPFQYLKLVARDFAQYVAPDAIVGLNQAGVPPSGMSFANTVPQNQAESPAQLASEFSGKYSHVDHSLPSQGIRELLGGYQEIFRLNGLVIVLLAFMAIAGPWVTRGHVRRAAVLLLLLSAYLYVVPVAASDYDVRYGVPPGLMLSAAAAIGAWGAIDRLRGRFGRQPLPV
jgi:hypothetical protein